MAPVATARQLRAIGPVLVALAAATTARAQDAAEPGPAPEPPKVVVVTVGDPDGPLREQAERVDRLLRDGEDVRVPDDAALRRALRGEPAAEDGDGDGLERARAVRRGLGMDEAADAPVLARLGRLAGAVAVVVVRRRGPAMEAVVLDVSRAAFFEGEVALADSGDEVIRRFVRSRARAATRRAASSTAIAAPPARPSPAPAPGEPARAPESGGDGEAEPSWLESNWALLVAGALLVGMIVYLSLPQDPAATPPPVLRFIPGGDR